jgi:uncharacterized protein
MPASVQALFEWHAQPGAFERLNPPFDPVEILSRSGGLEVGSKTEVRVSVGPVDLRWTAVHTAYEPPAFFVDEQQGGPFAYWRHTHRFLPVDENQSILEDDIQYALPMGAAGALVAGRFTEQKLEAAFRYRHALTRLDLSRHRLFVHRPRLTVAVTGASGSIGRALCAFLSGGKHVVRKIRRGADNSFAPADFENVDAVIHLAGAGVADERWSPARKKVLVDSRVQVTRSLVEALKAVEKKPTVLIGASAVGIYGDTKDEAVDEKSTLPARSDTGAGFLAGLCMDWEHEASQARELGIRVVNARIGIVQTANGGALSKLLTPFRAGVGGPTGSGQQWQSWIALEDVIGALHWALFTHTLQGPVNCVAPNPVTSAAYAKALGGVLHRPAIAPLPAFALRGLFGEMADGVLLPGQRVSPRALQQSGFEFAFPSLPQALAFTLGLASA